MKLKIYIVSILIGCLGLSFANAQTFTVAHDTVYATYSGTGAITYYNPISTPGSDVYIKWKMTACSFPSDWVNQINICDKCNCFPASLVWDFPLQSGPEHVCDLYPYTGPNGDFHMVIDLSSAPSSGTYYAVVKLQDTVTGSTVKNIVFAISKWPNSVSSLSLADKVNLYPNPAIKEINLFFPTELGVKTIIVYNLLGSLSRVYNPLANNSAMLNIDNMPSGVYFIRLMDAEGALITTRRFTKQ